MEKTIDQNLLKISGKTNIENAFEMGEEIHIQLKGSVVKIELSDNQDGTINRTIVVKAEDVMINKIL